MYHGKAYTVRHKHCYSMPDVNRQMSEILNHNWLKYLNVNIGSCMGDEATDPPMYPNLKLD